MNTMWAGNMWAGMVKQDDGLEYPISLAPNEEGFEVAYPTLGCSGSLRPANQEEQTFRFIEHIEIGADNCAQGVEIVLRPSNAKQLDAEFYLHDRLVAKGTLVRSPEFP